MLMLKNKANVLNQIKNCKTADNLHKVLVDNASINKLAQSKLSLMFDAGSHKFSVLKSLNDVTLSAPISLVCLKSDLIQIVKDY